MNGQLSIHLFHPFIHSFIHACIGWVTDIRENILLCEQQFGLFEGVDWSSGELDEVYPQEIAYYRVGHITLVLLTYLFFTNTNTISLSFSFSHPMIVKQVLI